MKPKLLNEKLETWITAGLLTSTQAQEISKYESTQQSGRSWVAFGVAAIGVVAIATGFISIIAANWDSIPAGFKIVVYLSIQTALGVAVYNQAESKGWLREVLLTLFALLVFAGIGLVAQIYHLEGETWKMLRFWLILSLPSALLARGFMLPRIWFFVLICAIVSWFGNNQMIVFNTDRAHADYIMWHKLMVVLTYIYGTIALGALSGHFGSSTFLVTAKFCGWISLMGLVVPVTNILWAVERLPHFSALPLQLTQLPFCMVLASIVAYSFYLRDQSSARGILFLKSLIIVSFVLLIVPLSFKVPSSDLLGMGFFLIEFTMAAIAAALLNSKRFFDLATFCISVRFVVAYFEVFGDLTTTGLGLIVSGLVILLVLYTWQKMRTRLIQVFGGQL
jgi:uncharacterized membrane protein